MLPNVIGDVVDVDAPNKFELLFAFKPPNNDVVFYFYFYFYFYYGFCF